MYVRMLGNQLSNFVSTLPVYQVVITNLEASSVIYSDAKKWPDAPADDASSFYKVNTAFMWRLINLNLCY